MITLNCDLGESFGVWRMPHDDGIMAHIDMANIACGYHAGDPLVMQDAIASAVKHKVKIGAHPSYPDRQGFGRRSLTMNEQELIAMIQYQVGALQGLARIQQQSVSYIKPHGALYNDMMSSDSLLTWVIKACAQFPDIDSLMIQSTANWQAHQELANQYGITLLFEAFADRLYTDSGKLTPRNEPGAVLDIEKMLQQAQSIIHNNTVLTASGSELDLRVDTLCVHGDSADAVKGVFEIRKMLNHANE